MSLLSAFIQAGLLSVADSLQLFGLVVLLVAGVAVGRVRRKDETIADLERANAAKDELLEALREQLHGAQERADEEHKMHRECEREVAHLQGEIKTLERYTAQGALEAVAERLATLENTVVTAVQANGEIVMKNTELLAKMIEQGESQTKMLNNVLERLLERLNA